MVKQLNTELFGESLSKDFEFSSNKSMFPLADAPLVPLDIDEQVRVTQEISNELSTQLDKVKAEQEEDRQVAKQKIDRLQSSLVRLEQSHNNFVQDLSEKFQLLIRKQSDQAKFEEKIRDLIDRHQNLINGYELRMQQLQKLLGQKEVEIIEMKSLLNEMKAELSLRSR